MTDKHLSCLMAKSQYLWLPTSRPVDCITDCAG